MTGKFRLLLVVAVLAVGLFGRAAAGGAATRSSVDGGVTNLPLVVHFKKNQVRLSKADKASLRALFHRFALGDKGRVFVVGHTDSSGSKKHNLRLSRRRARAVRRQLIAGFGLDPKKVLAIGRGQDQPVADNRRPAGQAANRRAEIYLSAMVDNHLKNKYGAPDTNLQAIDTLIQSARTHLHARRLNQAIRDLRKARQLGAERYSDWHATHGMVGFYAGVSADKVAATFRKALRIDPFNFEAREFLGRLTARQLVAAGKVTADMGRSENTPIAVISLAQEHEYLRQFGVTPVDHQTRDDRSLDIWRCRMADSRPVTYYFDFSKVYAWGFTAAATGSVIEPVPANPATLWESSVFQ